MPRRSSTKSKSSPVSEGGLAVLLDQNVPRAIAAWLRSLRPDWKVWHTAEVDLSGKSDPEVFDWAQAKKAVIVTFDEDFADRRMHPPGSHCGVIRLRVWPTTIEETQSALERLLEGVPEGDLTGCLVIVDARHIRIRKAVR